MKKKSEATGLLLPFCVFFYSSFMAPLGDLLDLGAESSSWTRGWIVIRGLVRVYSRRKLDACKRAWIDGCIDGYY